MKTIFPSFSGFKHPSNSFLRLSSPLKKETRMQRKISGFCKGIIVHRHFHGFWIVDGGVLLLSSPA